VQDLKHEMSFKQWLTLLERVRAAAKEKNGIDQDVPADTGAAKLSLHDFARRLEERKKKGYAGEYKGYSPPAEECEDKEASG